MKDFFKSTLECIIYSIFGYIIALCITPISVLADEVNVGYTTDYTNLILSNDRGADITLSSGVVNTTNLDIKSVIIYVEHSIDNDTEYILELSTPNATFTNVNEFSVIGYNRPNNFTCNVVQFDNSNTSYPKIHFKCPNLTSEYFTITLSNTFGNNITTGYDFRWNYTYLRYLTGTNDDNTQDIIDNQNQNTQDIIDNQNQNTQDTIESQNVCKNIDSSVASNGGYLNANGELTGNAGSGLRVSDYISINKTTKIRVLQNHTTTARTCFYDDTRTMISCITANSMTTNQLLTIPTNAKYVRFTINYVDNRPQFEVCNNGNQSLYDSLTDDSSIDMSSIGNTAGWLPAGPIDSIINLPLNFFNSISSALSGVCQPLTITIPFISQTIQIPCLSTIFGQISGLTTFWNWVGRIASVYILYRYLLALWDYYDRLTTLQVNFRDDFGGGV